MMIALEAIAQRWFDLFGPALLQNTLFLGLLLLILHAMRRSPASWRYALAGLGVLKLLLPPVLRLPLPGTPAIEEATGYALSWLPAAAAPSSLSAQSGLSLQALLFLFWLGGALFCTFVPLLGTLRLARRLHGARPLPEATLAGFDLPEGIRVYVSDALTLPLTLGFFPRRIFVPTDWASWTQHCRQLFLRHELAHLQRRDGFVQLLELFVRALWFFHPLVHLLGRHLHEYREMACDDRSLASDREDAPAYARYLIEAAESSLSTPSTVETASALMRRRRVLLKRVDYQMKGGSMLSLPKWKAGGVITAMVLMFVVLSWAMPGDEALAGKKDKSEKAYTIKKADKMKISGEEGIDVMLHGAGKMDMNGKSLPIAKFNKAMIGLAPKEGKAPLINIKCASTLPMGELYAFQTMLADRKLNRVRYVGADEGAVPYKLPGKKMMEKLAKIDDSHKLVLAVNDVGQCSLNGKKCKGKKLASMIEHRLAKNPKLILVIQTDAATTYGSFLKTFERAKKAGAKRVAIAPPKVAG